MPEQPPPPPPQSDPAPAGVQPPQLPDLNVGAHPFEDVTRVINEAACFNTLAVPGSGQPISGPGASGVIGSRIMNTLNRFECTIRPPSVSAGVTSLNRMGEFIATLEHRWMIIPEDHVSSMFREPPAAVLDTSRSQRFAMYDGKITFGDGNDGFFGFGTGRTYPTTVGRPRLLVGAVGEVLEGFGKLAGMRGSYVFSGEFSPSEGFKGNVLFRFMDPEGRMRNSPDVPPLQEAPMPNLGLTWIIFRGQKKDSKVRSEFAFGPDGKPQGFKLTQQLLMDQLDCAVSGPKGMRTQETLTQPVGFMNSLVFLDIFHPNAPGTSLAPIAFTSRNDFTFQDAQGQSIGNFTAHEGEGRTFFEQFPDLAGQQGLRFAAFQVFENGGGVFTGLEGIFTDNSITGVAPHVTTTTYTMCINDPDGKFRAR